MKLSYGFIETKGLISAIETADVMLKAAKVQLIKRHKVGAAFVTVIVQGDLDACQAAVDAGSMAADRIGQLISAHVIPHPYDDTKELVFGLKDGLKKKKIRKQPAKKLTLKPVKIEPAIEKPIDDIQQIKNLLRSKKKGLTLKQIATTLGRSSAEIRILVKKMMDEGSIEKVQHNFYLVELGDSK